MENQENYNASSFDDLISQINETAQDVQREQCMVTKGCTFRI